jgi:hypothetical protein
MAGVDFRSWTSRVEVTRPAHGDAQVRTIRVNVDKMLKSGNWSQNILLEPDDVVYIPPTPLAWLAQRAQEVIYPVRPALRAYSTPAHFMYADDVYDEEYRGHFVGRY